MRNEKFYEEFSAEWIASWNSHDIDRILSHRVAMGGDWILSL